MCYTKANAQDHYTIMQLHHMKPNSKSTEVSSTQTIDSRLRPYLVFIFLNVVSALLSLHINTS